MLVGPPGVLKTTLLDVLDDNYHNALSISNAFMGTMNKLQSSFYNGQIRSICFPDIQSMYAGDPRTAGRIEQMMMQLSGEASRTVGGGQDSRYAKFKSRCTIFGAMTDLFHNAKVEKWEGSGFLRRFLWSFYTLRDPNILIDAIAEWALADFGSTKVPGQPGSGAIKESLTQVERREIYNWLRHQPHPHEIQYQIMIKAVSVLRWFYKDQGIKKDAMHTMHEFAETLQHDAAYLVIPEQFYKNKHPKYPAMEQEKKLAAKHKGHKRKQV